MLLIINRNTNVILEAKNHLIFSKTSILRQKFEIFCKIWVFDAAYLWFSLLFLFRDSDLDIWHCLLVFFCDKFISSSTFVLDKVLIALIPWITNSKGVTHSLISLNKSCDDDTKHHRSISSQTNYINRTTQRCYELFYSFWFWISLIIKHT